MLLNAAPDFNERGNISSMLCWKTASQVSAAQRDEESSSRGKFSWCEV
jgi:hypothetical protein